MDIIIYTSTLQQISLLCKITWHLFFIIWILVVIIVWQLFAELSRQMWNQVKGKSPIYHWSDHYSILHIYCLMTHQSSDILFLTKQLQCCMVKTLNVWSSFMSADSNGLIILLTIIYNTGDHNVHIFVMINHDFFTIVTTYFPDMIQKIVP